MTETIHPVFEHLDLTDEVILLCKNNKPQLLRGFVDEYDFYDHPELGDKATLIAHNTLLDQWGQSNWWDLPDEAGIALKSLAGKVKYRLERETKYRDASVCQENEDKVVRLTIEYAGDRYRRIFSKEPIISAKYPGDYVDYLSDVVVGEFCKQ